MKIHNELLAEKWASPQNPDETPQLFCINAGVPLPKATRGIWSLLMKRNFYFSDIGIAQEAAHLDFAEAYECNREKPRAKLSRFARASVM
jgi:hypothetical protein